MLDEALTNEGLPATSYISHVSTLPQVVHKRLKAHLYMEPFCLLMERSFSEFNPIYDMLQYHCRATLETNKLYDMKLYGKKNLFSQKLPHAAIIYL